MPINNNTYNPTTYNSTSTPKNYKRGNPIPLDNTALWNSLDDAKAYAKDNATAYVGQIISVVENNKEAAYIITETMQEDGSYLRPIADLSKIEQDIADLKELPEHKEVKMANEVGNSTDDTYSIKKIDGALYITNKNVEDKTTNNLIIDPSSTKIQQAKIVDIDETMVAVGGLISTLKTHPDEIFTSLDELREDMAASTDEHVRGAKVQRLFDGGMLASGCDYRECNELTSVRNAKGVKFILDDSGNGYVDCAYSVNSVFDVTYAENMLKIIRFGDFYFYVVYNDEHLPTGAFCIGRPEGTLTGDNYAASWRFLDVDEITEEQLADPTTIPDVDGNTWTMWPRPYTKFAALNEDFMVTGASWGTGGDFYRLVQVDSRYFIILSRKGTSGAVWNGDGDESGLYCPQIIDYNFSIKEKRGSTNITHYILAKDYFTVSQAGAPPSPSNILKSFDLLQILAGKGQLVNNVDEYALPSSSANLWGGYWPNKAEFRVGTFDPDISSYDYADHSGAKAAYKLNPAGNYCIGKLENFHPLRMEDGSELYIRTATIKGFKTTLDWPNASIVKPSDCNLRSGDIWIQYIWAYPVKEAKPRLFFRVLFDGYINSQSYKEANLSNDIRYPWSSCYELTNNSAIEEAKKYTDEAITQAISELEIPEMPEVIYTEIQQADVDTLGGIKIGYEQNDKNYPVKLDDTGKAFVEVPWTDTNTTDLTGDGSALINLNANNITTGIIDEERLPKKYMTEFRINFDGVNTVSMDDSSSQVTAYIFIKTFSNTKYTTGSTGTFELSDFGSFCAKACSISGHLSWTHENSQRIALIPHNILVSNGNVCYYGTKILADSVSNIEEYITPSAINYTVISSVEI